MAAEPTVKRTMAFVDGQNFFYSVREAFGYTYPNYDISALSQSICENKGWKLAHVRFYTGVPDQADNRFWNYFWTHKLAMLGRQGVNVFSRPLRYRNRRGIEKTDWIRIDRAIYDACLDRRDYRLQDLSEKDENS